MDHLSTKKYDADLQKIAHYKAFPLMMPYVGPSYKSDRHKKLLLIGESFYLPPESTVHKNANEWYKKNASVLNEEEIRYLDCRGLLEGDWVGGTGHTMYLEIDRCLRTCISGLKDNERATSHIAYTNAFLRPASESGKSFKFCCEDIDRKVSVEVIDAVVKSLQPDFVIYLTRFGWDEYSYDGVGELVAGLNPSVAFEHVNHPTSPAYNDKSKKCGREQLIDLLKTKFIS